MTRDYKSSSKRSARGSSKSGGNVFTGIVIGLLLGIIIALGIVLYLNRSVSPFVNKVQQPDPKKPPVAKKPEMVKPLESAAAPPTAAPGDKPRFDFYDILPGDKDPSRRPAEKNPKETPAPPAPPPAAKAPAPPSKPPETTAAKPAAPSKDNYYLQAGSFRSSGDADNLKARLALMGLEANVASAEVPNVGTMYRVRLGPYKSSDEVVAKRDQLSQNGIQANVIKMAAGQNN